MATKDEQIAQLRQYVHQLFKVIQEISQNCHICKGKGIITSFTLSSDRAVYGLCPVCGKAVYYMKKNYANFCNMRDNPLPADHHFKKLVKK